jgi:GAF domain-containing protein
VGLNPLKAYDNDYKGFIELICGAFVNAITTARTYEEQRQRTEALAAIDKAKTVFFSNVSHEFRYYFICKNLPFRTPLSLMLGPLEDILHDANSNLKPETRAKLVLVQVC